MFTQKKNILIAGIAGASLGTEILKCLNLTGKYTVYGCDVAGFAYGHYSAGFEKTFLIDERGYTEAVMNICKRYQINLVIPGAEEPMVILNENSAVLKEESIHLLGNTPEIVKTFSDKNRTFALLGELGFPVPKTVVYTDAGGLKEMPFPAVVKPSVGSGGSSFVFFSQHAEEAQIYSEYLIRNGKAPVIQEYIPDDEGEFTVGVLHRPNGEYAGCLALKRAFPNKLSVHARYKNGLISSGYTQGLIDDFPHVERTARDIAGAVKSRGPLNIQGRVRKSVFMPFEINPRFSASTYLRAMAGFNEIDWFIESLYSGEIPVNPDIKHGYYLRSFTEVFVEKDQVKKEQEKND